MDKIKFSYRTGGVDLKEVAQKWEEELFSKLISNKEAYLPNVANFTDECFDDYMKMAYKVYALLDIGIIDKVESDILTDKFYEIEQSYVKSKVKEVF